MNDKKIMDTIIRSVLKKINPNKKVIKEAELFVQSLNNKFNEKKIKATAILGGSIAKDTFLKNDYDIDVFVRFDYSYKEKNISDILESVLPKKSERVHGSRDYFQLRNGKLNFEIVPVLFVTDYKKALNVTDMSPLHVEWVKERIKKNEKLREEIRLLKQFCKAVGVYGAESYIKGLSGHVIDILVIYYGSFLAALRAVSNWKDITIIDPEKHLRDPLRELNKSKLQSPLIIVDPVQKNRNASAAVSKEKYEKFIKCAKDFMNNPSEDFFTVKSLDIKELKILKKASKNYFVIIDVYTYKNKKDIMGTRFMQVYDKLLNTLKVNNFNVVKSDWYFNKDLNNSIMYFEIKNEKLSKTIMWRGPPLKEKDDYKRFVKKYDDIIIQDKRVYAKIKRTYMEPIALVKDVLNSDYIKEKITRSKIIY
ncbi:MAG: CCA tRNA nucleotidyltransferase [Candidatus Woesearchaeota archaeon]